MRAIDLIGFVSALQLFSVRNANAEGMNHSMVAHNSFATWSTNQIIIGKKKTPIITWANPQPIRVGVPLGPDQLNATANVDGTFAYTPPGGTVLPAGPNQTLSVNFTPKDQDHYKPVKATVQITVNPKGQPVIAWSTPLDITYGEALGSAQLNATADVSGTFVYTPPSGTVLPEGANQALKANFSPTDYANYDTASATVYINVNKESVISSNHPPILTNMEGEPIEYDRGDRPIPITKEIILSDMDDNFMYSARIILTENYKKGDLLILDGTPNLHVTSAFDPLKGELLLTGKDSKANYETALHNVSFSSPVSGDTSLSIRIVTIVVKDSSAESNIASRSIQITNEYPALSIVNAFTPNSDRVNDYWDFVNLQFYKEIKIAVFDENGQRVYDCGNKDCKWDGKNNGKDLPAGPYYYSINLDKGKRNYRGTVTILK